MTEIINKNILDWCKEYKGEKFHALLCDPPYELGFMGKDWDRTGIAFNKDTWIALKEHMYDGAFGMAFSSSRGWHRMAVAIEDSGMIIHPSIFLWGFGSGFPKATRIDTQIQPIEEQIDLGQSDNWRESKRGREKNGKMEVRGDNAGRITEPTDELAKAWVGHRYGLQALKPAVEVIIVFQKPYKGKAIDCIVKTGAGAINVDGGRIGNNAGWSYPNGAGGVYSKEYQQNNENAKKWNSFSTKEDNKPIESTKGRWPANFILEHHAECVKNGEKKIRGTSTGNGNAVIGEEGKNIPLRRGTFIDRTDEEGKEVIEDWDCHLDCPVRRMGEQAGERTSGARKKEHKVGKTGENGMLPNHGIYSDRKAIGYGEDVEIDKGTASRFFFNAVQDKLDESDPVYYCSKASRREREEGLDGMVKKTAPNPNYGSGGFSRPTGQPERETSKTVNNHPTIKPIDLTSYLSTLLLPPSLYSPRRILVPFAGVASEMIGAMKAGWEEVVGIEMEKEYCRIGEARLEYWKNKKDEKGNEKKEKKKKDIKSDDKDGMLF